MQPRGRKRGAFYRYRHIARRAREYRNIQEQQQQVAHGRPGWHSSAATFAAREERTTFAEHAILLPSQLVVIGKPVGGNERFMFCFPSSSRQSVLVVGRFQRTGRPSYALRCVGSVQSVCRFSWAVSGDDVVSSRFSSVGERTAARSNARRYRKRGSRALRTTYVI